MDGSLRTAAPLGRQGLAPERAFLAASALLFLACAAGTIYWSLSMPMGMSMPGGWTLSMAWVRMPGQSWPGAAAAFLGTWVVMMAAMMLPSLAPMLVGFRRAWRVQGAARLGWLAALAGAGYFCVWAAWGAVVYPVGALLSAAEMQSMDLAGLAPLAAGIVLLAAGGLQLTAWKRRQLECAPQPPALGARPAGAAWRYGLRLGLHCSLCCSGLMLVLLALGVMDLRVMVSVAAAITLEQIAPAPAWTARTIGAAAILAGLFTLARALGIA